MTRWATSVQNSFAEAASAAVSSPASSASSARSATAWAASTSAWQAASSNLVFWNEATVLPKTVRSCTYSLANRTAAAAWAYAPKAMPQRSEARLVPR